MERNDSVTRWLGPACGHTWYPKNIVASRERLFKNLNGIQQRLIRTIPDLPILQFLRQLQPRWGCSFEGFNNSVQKGMPEGITPVLARFKMKELINRGLVSGCTCGCRGDFRLTEKALYILPSN